MSRFRKATRRQGRARVALVGPSGSGKTYTALLLARGLAGPDGRIAVVDTERGSASKYAGAVTDFDVLELEQHGPADYVRAIEDAAAERFDVLVLDSLSHAWSGRGGALELVDRETARSRSSNSFAAWRTVTPQHNALIDAILAFPGHVVATMRAKTEYAMERDKDGKTTPRKIGLAPVQRDGVEYEFDVVADIDPEHRMIVSKSRCPELADAVLDRPGLEVGEQLRAWLDEGEAMPPPAPKAPSARELLGHALEELEQAEDVGGLAAWMTVHVPATRSLPTKARGALWAAMIERGAALGLDEPAVRAMAKEATT